MKIALVVTNTKGRNLFFAIDAHHAYSLAETIQLAKTGALPGVYPVKGVTGEFLRTVPYIPKQEELEALSISISRLYDIIQGTRKVSSAPALRAYLKVYEEGARAARDSYITLVEYPLPAGKKIVKEKLQLHRTLIFKAAEHFKIDPYILGALLVDEIARALPFEEMVDKIKGQILGKNASAGVAQVKLDTAYNLMIRGLYNPNPRDKKLAFSNFTNEERKYLYTYVMQPKHSIFFAGAFVRHVINFWLPYINLSKHPEIIGTLYHQGYGEPKESPAANPRGAQIGEEFYSLAKKWLKK